MFDKTYIAIDLKSFYASAECVDRGLDPLRTNLVVADPSRTDKTICLAVSPSLKGYGVPGRPRLFEVKEKVNEINFIRKKCAPGGKFKGESYDAAELKRNPSLKLSFITAPPRMARYIEVSAKVHDVYLKYIAPEDMHVYSIDEVFMDVTAYLRSYGLTAKELAMKMITDVLKSTGITATAGIGSNLYLCKIAMDIIAKHLPADENGVRIAELSERSYREKLWDHTPLTDFWRIGKGYASALARHGLYTMGDVALCSVNEAGEDLLYSLFGVNAELLIDHAWGYESCTMADIRSYRPKRESLSNGQVLKEPCTKEKAALLIKEMAELLSLDLVDKKLAAREITITINYDAESLKDPRNLLSCKGKIKADHYGRPVPVHARGTKDLGRYTSSTRLMIKAALELYEKITDERFLIRRLNIAAVSVVREEDIPREEFVQLSFFDEERKKEDERLEKEKKAQEAALKVKKMYGKNALIKGMDLEEGATSIERNGQIGGHRA